LRPAYALNSTLSCCLLAEFGAVYEDDYEEKLSKKLNLTIIPCRSTKLFIRIKIKETKGFPENHNIDISESQV